MNLPEHEILRRLGAGVSLAAVLADAGSTADAFAAWWRSTLRGRVPASTGVRRCGVRHSVSIRRDDWGIPHIHADNDADLFFGFGYAMAQDRLWQLDFFRRKGAGRLGRDFGPAKRRTAISWSAWSACPACWTGTCSPAPSASGGSRSRNGSAWHTETCNLLTAFADGINAHIDEIGDELPIEFGLLDYRPEPWTPVDCLTIEGDFRWYLTGRFPVIVIPELARRVLGDGPLYRAFPASRGATRRASCRRAISAQAVRGHPAPAGGRRPRRPAGAEAAAITGWSAGTVSATASRCSPAIRTCRLTPCRGGTRSICAAARSTWRAWPMPACPAVMFGRTERVAWGCTNNICSQRDLYQEKTDPAPSRLFPLRRPLGAGPRARGSHRGQRSGPGAKDDPLFAQWTDCR